MEFIPDPKSEAIINSYPPEASDKLYALKELIVNTASETDGIKKMRETLKWGEPSYVVNKGSTIRIDWKKRNPDYCAIYFICSTSLVATFRIIFGDELEFEDNRAILIPIQGQIPTKALKQCITLALTYHHVKHLPLLGA